MKNNVCIKNFPKKLQEYTTINEQGKTLYKRSSGRKAEVRGKTIDDGYIVPYNPYLILKYNCHINVEVCASMKAVKYLFKYIYKGHDCSHVEFSTEDKDEITKFLDTR